jgi:hypothetical protein
VIAMSSFDQAGHFADQGARIAGDSVRTAPAPAAARESLSQIERSFATSIETVRDFNLKMIAMMRANAMAAFELAHNLATATSPTDVFETWKSFAQQRVEIEKTAERRDFTTFASDLESQFAAMTAQVAVLEAKVAALQAAPLKVKASFGETPHTGWTPSKVVVLGNDSHGSLVELPSTIEPGGFRYTGAPSFWIALG